MPQPSLLAHALATSLGSEAHTCQNIFWTVFRKTGMRMAENRLKPCQRPLTEGRQVWATWVCLQSRSHVCWSGSSCCFASACWEQEDPLIPKPCQTPLTEGRQPGQWKKQKPRLLSSGIRRHLRQVRGKPARQVRGKAARQKCAVTWAIPRAVGGSPSPGGNMAKYDILRDSAKKQRIPLRIWHSVVTCLSSIFMQIFFTSPTLVHEATLALCGW